MDCLLLNVSLQIFFVRSGAADSTDIKICYPEKLPIPYAPASSGNNIFDVFGNLVTFRTPRNEQNSLNVFKILNLPAPFIFSPAHLQ